MARNFPISSALQENIRPIFDGVRRCSLVKYLSLFPAAMPIRFMQQVGRCGKHACLGVSPHMEEKQNTLFLFLVPWRDIMQARRHARGQCAALLLPCRSAIRQPLHQPFRRPIGQPLREPIDQPSHQRVPQRLGQQPGQPTAPAIRRYGHLSWAGVSALALYPPTAWSNFACWFREGSCASHSWNGGPQLSCSVVGHGVETVQPVFSPSHSATFPLQF